eukprot:gnl/MRDRNA2_/MRDRNA2_27318_c0_seq1.p1 gnl/MRDRNA2_/MRDRNA2_27318_c0~~gnl/MRDRNA2_/MRDRNA2_27318_c0_seq1.p1  ORF type:complete len:420 (+),score=98.64 gnl/MRDRNA2_/MRDRNA2_27318_c0_seq1:71-1330(+)
MMRLAPRSGQLIHRHLCSSARCFAAANPLLANCEAILQEAKEAGTYKVERVITTPQSAAVSVQESTSEVLNFCANNYLGLSNHPALVQAATDTLQTHGFGMSSVRFICGTQDIHKELERKIAAFHGMDDAILFPSCFDANAGIFEAVLGPEDAVITASLNHASIIDGIRLCKAKRFRYGHIDMADLEAKLIEAKDCRIKLVVTDGVFSMDGDVAPLPEIRALADKYGAQLFVDECHATGVLGKTGRGTPELMNTKVDIINTTLGKALGGATGGYTVGPQAVIDTLRQKARPYLFSNSVAPAVVGASLAALKLMEESGHLLAQLQKNTKYFRTHMAAAGFNILGHDACPIVPVLLKDARLAADFANKMLEKDIYVIGFSYPVVPKGQARIRVQLSGGHSDEQVKKAVDAFVQVGKELKCI